VGVDGGAPDDRVKDRDVRSEVGDALERGAMEGDRAVVLRGDDRQDVQLGAHLAMDVLQERDDPGQAFQGLVGGAYRDHEVVGGEGGEVAGQAAEGGGVDDDDVVLLRLLQDGEGGAQALVRSASAGD